MNREPANYAYYRLPGESRYTLMAQTEGEPLSLRSAAELDCREGFVMAPFAVSAQCPILLMRPDVVEIHASEASKPPVHTTVATTERPTEKDAYAADFAHFHAAVCAGRFDKIVLSRCSDTPLPDNTTARRLFLKACNAYPHQFVALVGLRQAGTWLMATPEVMLEGTPNLWHTTALAGTMRRSDAMPNADTPQWSEKNRSEQQYVTTYIRHILAEYADTISVQGPYTSAAAHLLHLKTDFAFTLKPNTALGTLLNSLYPTPAVCGIPKADAHTYISTHEQSPRKYYGGFCGPLFPHGETHLYVSLRCMEILGNTAKLYAGGGLLRDSNAETEWKETQTKMQTMMRLLNS